MDTTMTPLVAGRYNRVSDDRRKLKRSVGEQEAEGLAAGLERGWADGGSWTDNDLSGSRFAKKVRKEWVKLIEDVLPSKRLDVLVLWEPSRGTRLLSAWALLLETCHKLGILVHITSHDTTYDLSNPRHWKTLAEDGVTAVYEVEQSSKRIRRGVAALAASGKPTGKVRYGYQRLYDPKTKAFIEEIAQPEQAAIVEEAAKWIAAKKSLGALQKNLHDRGIKAPAGGEWWSTAQLKLMVLNPAYIGLRVHQGTVVGDAAWPAILTPELQRACRDVLKAEGRSKQRDGGVHHVLSGIAVSNCGGAMRVKPTGGSLHYYCAEDGCVSMRKDLLEDYVDDVMKARLARRDLLAELVADDDGSAAAAADELVRLQADLEACYRQAEPSVPEDERLSPLGLARMERQYQPLIAAARAKAEALRVPHVLRDVASMDPASWPSWPMSQRREILRTLTTIRVKPAGRSKSTPPEDRVDIVWVSRRSGA